MTLKYEELERLAYEELERLAYMANDPMAKVYGELDDALQTIEELEHQVDELTTQVEELEQGETK